MNVGFQMREPMLVSGHVDNITGLSFSSYMNIEYGGVPSDDIAVLLRAQLPRAFTSKSLTVLKPTSAFWQDRPETDQASL
jgi:hypothetical protein